MNIATALLPVATAALETAVQGVGDVLQSGTAFARLLRGNPDSGKVAKSASPVGAELAPEQTELAMQMRHDALRQRFETLRQSVHAQVTQHFAANGIDLSEPVVLSVDANGRLLETSNHWDRARIEEALQADTQLRADITELLAHGSALRELGQQGSSGGAAGDPRVVIGEKEAFIQVV